MISTAGDRSSAPIAQLGVGVFVSALRDALAAGEVDVAVHSYKDLPTAPDPRLVLAAIPPREDPRDALVARDGLVLGELPAGSVIGTSSVRRAAQLRALGLGLEIRPLRGNLDTRLNRVSNGDLDAVVVARAGLARIGRLAMSPETFLEPVQMLPAPAQGALAVECRAGDTGLAELWELDDADTRAAVTAEQPCSPNWRYGLRGAIAVESIDEDGNVFEELSLRGCVAGIRRDPGRVVENRSGPGAGALGGRGGWVRELMEERVIQMSMRGRKAKPGRILFVGSGPGDPGLLTTRARTVFANAALVFTDPDVPEQVLAIVGSELSPASGTAPAPETPTVTRAPTVRSRSTSWPRRSLARTSARRSAIPPEVARILAHEARLGTDVVGWSPVTRCRSTRCSPR